MTPEAITISNKAEMEKLLDACFWYKSDATRTFRKGRKWFNTFKTKECEGKGIINNYS